MQYYQRIRDLREDNDFTQKDVYQKLNMQKTTYTNYEQGKRELPLEIALELAKIYNVSIDYLAGRTKDKKGLAKETLNPDEEKILAKYKNLTERQKGKVELLLEQLTEENAKETEIKNKDVG